MSVEAARIAENGLDHDDPRIRALLESPLIQQSEVIGIREGGIVDCWVPTELIDHEEVPVKEEWARSLANEMHDIAESHGGSGQLSPVVMGLIEGEDQLKIMDGFHRDAALKINGEKRVYSAVQLTDWDGLYDVRIFTAKDHAHVRFSRVVQWIREVWDFSDLADKMSIEQAVLLYRFETDGSKLGIDPEDVSAAKAWVARKEEQWDMAAMTIHSHLKIAETVDPKLIHSTREKKKSVKLEAPTQAIIKVFSEHLPNDFELQNLVMEQAKGHNLTGPEVKTLSNLVAGEDPEEARSKLSQVNFDELKPSLGKSQQKAQRQAHDTRHKGASVFVRAEWEIQSILRRAQLSAERGEEIDDGMAVNIIEAIGRANSLKIEIAKTAMVLGQLVGEKPESIPGTQEATTETKRTVPAKRAEAKTDDTGELRQDIINYLAGSGELGSVSQFSHRELLDCFREMDGQKSQPEGWRERFIKVQQASLAGKLD